LETSGETASKGQMYGYSIARSPRQIWSTHMAENPGNSNRGRHSRECWQRKPRNIEVLIQSWKSKSV